MAKKIYDIKPPKIAKKIENTIKELASPIIEVKKTKRTKKVAAPAVTPIIAPKHTSSLPKKPRQTESTLLSRRNIMIGGGIIALLLCIFLYNYLQSATVEISPTMSEVSLQEKILADKSVKDINITTKVIPAEYIEVEREVTQEFPASGTSSTDSKATGTITIFNKVDPAAPVTLLKGTHFLADSGKYFVTLAKVVIPAAKSKSSPGSVSVSVQAEGVGPDYNIGASKFSVPKLSGTAYYYGIYAESSKKMSGGSTGKVKKVTKDDIEDAEDTLTQNLLKDAEKALQDSLSDNDLLLTGATAKTVVSATSSEEANAAADKFSESVKVKFSALVFKKDDLNKFVEDYINSKLENDEEFLKESLKIEYTSDLVDLKKGTEAVNVTISAKSYHGIDQNALLSSIAGKSASQVTGAIEDKYGDNVAATKVSLWPFWTTKAPTNNKKIKIKLNFE